MKIVIFEPVAEGDIPHEPLTVDVGSREVVCHEVFCGIGIETPQGRFGIAQRDGGIEVLLNGELVYSSTEPEEPELKPPTYPRLGDRNEKGLWELDKKLYPVCPICQITMGTPERPIGGLDLMQRQICERCSSRLYRRKVVRGEKGWTR